MSVGLDAYVADLGDVLRRDVDPTLATLEPLGRGLFSLALAGHLNGRAMVVRLSRCPDDFAKDWFAFERLSSPSLPIPRLTRIAPLVDDVWYAISERCLGDTLSRITPLEQAVYAPVLLSALEQIWSFDVSPLRGWGLTDPQGHGAWSSESAYQLSFFNQKFDYRWQQADQPPLLEWPLIAQGIEAVTQLARYLPSERWLVHGDFGYHNLVGHNQRLTGILDWAEARLGDFVYDLAALAFDDPTKQLCGQWLNQSPLVVPHFWERVQFHSLMIAIHSLSIAAVLHNADEYGLARTELLRLLESFAE